MRGTKARFYTSLLSHKNGKIMKCIVDGYWIDYKGMNFGVYRRSRNTHYIIIELETGLKIMEAERLRDIDSLALDIACNEIMRFRNGEHYEKYVKDYEKAKIYKKKVSCYDWKNNYINLIGEQDESCI